MRLQNRISALDHDNRKKNYIEDIGSELEIEKYVGCRHRAEEKSGGVNQALGEEYMMLRWNLKLALISISHSFSLPQSPFPP